MIEISRLVSTYFFKVSNGRARNIYYLIDKVQLIRQHRNFYLVHNVTMQKRIKSRKLLYRRKLSKFHLRSIINSFSNFVSGVNDGVKVARNIQEENPRLCQIPNVKKATTFFPWFWQPSQFSPEYIRRAKPIWETSWISSQIV